VLVTLGTLAFTVISEVVQMIAMAMVIVLTARAIAGKDGLEMTALHTFVQTSALIMEIVSMEFVCAILHTRASTVHCLVAPTSVLIVVTVTMVLAIAQRVPLELIAEWRLV